MSLPHLIQRLDSYNDQLDDMAGFTERLADELVGHVPPTDTQPARGELKVSTEHTSLVGNLEGRLERQSEQMARINSAIHRISTAIMDSTSTSGSGRG